MKWLLLCALAGACGCTSTLGPSYAVIETSFGEITMKLHTKEAPRTCANFIDRADDLFYNGLHFFRVVKGMLIQTGCERNDGTGGPKHGAPLETTPYKHVPGAVAMERKSDNVDDSHGSQFYIVTGTLPDRDGRFCVFGKVVKGMDVVKKIEDVEVEEIFIGPEPFHRPKEPVVVKRVTIHEGEPPK